MNYKKIVPVMAVTVGMAAGLTMAANANGLSQDLFQLTEINSNGTLLANHEDGHSCGSATDAEHSCGAADAEAEVDAAEDHQCGSADDTDDDHKCGAADDAGDDAVDGHEDGDMDESGNTHEDGEEEAGDDHKCGAASCG